MDNFIYIYAINISTYRYNHLCSAREGSLMDGKDEDPEHTLLLPTVPLQHSLLLVCTNQPKAHH
jgi:hypothetical protein